MVIKNNNAEGDVYFNEHVIKPGEELRLPMAPIPPIGWTGTLNDLVAVDPKKTLAAEHLRRTWGKTVWVGHEPREAVDKDGRNATDNDFERSMRDANPDWQNRQEPLKRIDKIGRY